MAQDTWYQQALTPPTVLEGTIRIGVIPEQDHVQVLAELKDPTTGILVAQRSQHHGSMHQLGHMLTEARGWLEAMIGEQVDPF